MHTSNLHARYAHHLTGNRPGNRTFLLHQGETLRMTPTGADRYLYVMSGDATVIREDGSSVHLSAEDKESNPMAAQPNALMTIEARNRLHLLDVDIHAVDELHAWDALSDHIQDEVLSRRMDMVRGSETFRSLPAESVQEALESMELIDVAASETIINQGEEGKAFYIIVSGEAEVWKSGLYDDELKLVGSLSAGAPFGEDALISGLRESETVKMKTSGHLLRLKLEDFQKLVTPAMINEVNPELAKAMMADGYKTIDVRYPEEYEDGHIPASTLVPLYDLQGRMNEFQVDARYVVYCHSGRRSAVASMFLRQAGMNVASLKGGIANWPYDTEA